MFGTKLKQNHSLSLEKKRKVKCLITIPRWILQVIGDMTKTDKHSILFGKREKNPRADERKENRKGKRIQVSRLIKYLSVYMNSMHILQ